MRLRLPPLPPDLAPAGEPPWLPAGRSLVDVLGAEHAQLLALVDKVAAAAASDRSQVVDVLTATVSRHLAAERQYLYPTVCAVLSDGEAVARREIALEQRLQRALLAAAGPDGLAMLLRDHVRRHVVVGERLLAALCSAVTDADLIRLGNRAEIAATEAPTRPHPNLPTTPPWNKVVDTAAGLLDKAYDAVSGRPTSPADLAVGADRHQ